MSLSDLRDNLQEIYSAAHDPRNIDLVIVPNLFGTRVYHTSRGWGRLWRWLFNLISPFVGEDFKLKKLRQAMQKTERTFQEHLIHIQDHIKTYQGYLQKKSTDDSLDENDFHTSRDAITEWNDATTIFLKALQGDKKEKITEFFDKYGTWTLENWGQNFELHQQMQKIIDLEGHLHEPLPLSIMVKLATLNELEKEEKRTLDNWVSKLKKLETKIKIGPFHDALRAIVYSSSDKELDAVNLANLEFILSKELLLFQHEDPEHVKWRSSLKKGGSVDCNGNKIILGEQLGRKLSGVDNDIFFSIQDDPENVVRIGKNRAILGLEKRFSEFYKSGARSAEFLEIDDEGRCAIVERLQDPVAQDEPEEIARPIAGAVKWMVQENGTPRNLSPTQFMFNKEKQLRSVKLRLLGNFDYIALEKFIYACAKEDRNIFHYMMTQSDLYSHHYRKFYRKMLKNGLKGRDKTADVVAIFFKEITDPKIIESAQALYDEAKKLKNSCCQKIKKHSDVSDETLLASNVRDAIVECYDSAGTGSILWPTTEQDVIAFVTKTMKLQPKVSVQTMVST
ncbi:MAG: hypothetical protein K940chlam7_00725 [Chlamydiae bacterium]|nr:hypothetical protein [Chlamydiota bacterium]